jgi:hypothetical protein
MALFLTLYIINISIFHNKSSSYWLHWHMRSTFTVLRSCEEYTSFVEFHIPRRSRLHNTLISAMSKQFAWKTSPYLHSLFLPGGAIWSTFRALHNSEHKLDQYVRLLALKSCPIMKVRSSVVLTKWFRRQYHVCTAHTFRIPIRIL